VPDRHPHGAFDQGHHGDADSGLTKNYFSKPFIQAFAISSRQSAVISIAIG
jgi:hypothetical protein